MNKVVIDASSIIIVFVTYQSILQYLYLDDLSKNIYLKFIPFILYNSLFFI